MPERIVVTTLVVLLLAFWGGFTIHESSRFAGSLAGGVLGISAAALMVFTSLWYAAVKRIPSLKRKLTAPGALGKILLWHVYTAALGAILAILHTGHRFESTLGIALTASVLTAALSGYVGRHALARVSMQVRDKQAQLSKLGTAYNEAVAEAARGGAFDDSASQRAVGLAEAIAELEFSIRSHERSRHLASGWLTVHIASSIAFYALLALHVWASIYFGLRWIE